MSANREESLDRLRRGLQLAREGQARVIEVGGGIGVGKSWLLGQLLAEVGDDLCVLRCTGHPAEADLPYAGLHQLVSPLLHRLPELPEQQVAAISGALALIPATPQDTLALSVGLLGLITLEAESRPVVIIVDDLHWLDTSTRRALTFVGRRLDADAVLMILAARTGPGEAPWPGGFERVDLLPLSPEESLSVLRAAHPDLSVDASARVLDEAAGLPLALLQVPADLSEAQRTGAAPLPQALPSGSSLEQFYLSRLGGLGGHGRQALAVASLDELTLPQLRSALSTMGLALTDLESAEASGLVKLTDTGVTFIHPTARSAAQRTATFAELQRAHQAIVAALPSHSTRAAWHLESLATGADDVAAEALDRAAQDAWTRSAFEEAGRAWRASADRSTDAATAHDRRVRAVDAYLRLGSGAALTSLLGRLRADATETGEKAQWQSVLLITGLFSNADPPPYEEIESLARPLITTAPEAASRLLSTYALILVYDGETRRACAVVDELRRLLPDHEFSLSDSLVHDDIDLLAGRPDAGRLLRSDWASSLTDAELCDPSIPVNSSTVHAAWIGEVDRARRVIDRQYEALQAGGGVSLIDLNLAAKATIVRLRGNWDEANALFTNAGELSRASDFAAPMPHIRLRHAYLLAARGNEVGTRAIIREVQELPASRKLIHRHLIECVLGLLELSLGNLTDAARHLAEAGRIEEATGTREPGFDSRFGDLFEVSWRLNRAQELAGQLDEFERRASSVSRHGAMAVAARCRGMVAGPGEVDATFEAALALHDRAPDPFESARTELAWGQRLRRERRRADARPPLHRALDSFEHLGAGSWAAVARSELAACGERRAAASAGPLGSLTPREYEVATTVAAGASNAEAAARLFVSQRTVEYHLSAVFRKLGVQGRAALAAALKLE